MPSSCKHDTAQANWSAKLYLSFQVRILKFYSNSFEAYHHQRIPLLINSLLTDQIYFLMNERNNYFLLNFVKLNNLIMLYYILLFLIFYHTRLKFCDSIESNNVVMKINISMKLKLNYMNLF